MRKRINLSEFDMNKKNIGISFGKILWLVLSLFAAVVLWLFAKYNEVAPSAIALLKTALTLF